MRIRDDQRRRRRAAQHQPQSEPMSAQYHDQWCAGRRGARGTDGVQQQRPALATQQLLGVSEPSRATGGEQYAGERGRTTGCESDHVPTILNA